MKDNGNTAQLRKMTVPDGTSTTDHFQEWMKITSKPKSALLIDDSKEETALIVKQSDAFNIAWEVCHTGEMALDKLGYKKYQLIVLDLKLGSQPDGVDLFRRMKAACPQCPVLVLSGYITNEIIVEVTKVGFAMFAQKPAVFDSLFFEQLFLALNIPRKNQDEAESGCGIPPGANI